ncbi:GlsB/YeaQ/YmgE family stress response membrane protein [Microcoleus sp. FACHB-68]|uniref:GlsB/YeaQ/YmgE family stress response membrane protein n=1 Tax=Microcoleus sp. FACHB-68 TaxID=2692826 RepID=UPI001682DC57|nr:GlsB/YeaQ/YmgE family stress response membrane protein [Microcoleus sp. FACHB-68]MBD1937341.1 GlsB/YeaQ/YmgE family stress response membrane protein [Microcoleus sp. FACHB-68]
MMLLLLPIIGIVAGWLPSYFTKAHKFGLPANIALGVWGSIVGHLVFDLLGLSSYSLIGSLVVALAGAVAGQSLAILIEIA